MRRNPERTAWIVVWTAFFTFCFIVVAVPLAVRQYLLYAQNVQKATVESVAGTVVVEPPVGRGPAPLSKGQSMKVPEGTIIRLDDKSEAFVTFYDHSVMRVFSGSTLRLERMRSPRYTFSPLPAMVHLTLQGGRVSIGTAALLGAPLDLRVMTLHGQAVLAADGSYALEVSNARSEIAVHRGHATVSAQGTNVELSARQRTVVDLGYPPQPAMGMARNLVVNGDFREPVNAAWRIFNDQGTDGGGVDGYTALVVDEGRRAVAFYRMGGHGNHCETILEQTFDKPLPDPITSLIVRATVKVRYQSLSGGGYLSSEYPLMIRLTYRDVYDSEAEWIQGFYYENPAGTPTMYGQQIPHDRWYLFESGNLLDTLPIRPFRLMRLRVYASGWDYESLISDISLIVE